MSFEFFLYTVFVFSLGMLSNRLFNKGDNNEKT